MAPLTLAWLASALLAGADPYPEAHPPAGQQPVRPAGYTHFQYPQSPQELLTQYGPQMEQRARQAWSDIDQTNAKGAIKPTPESLATHACPAWFRDAKIGMFIDWGPWSVGGYASPSGGAAYPDWYEFNLYNDPRVKAYHAKAWGADLGDDDLINLLSDRRFDARGFAALAKACGFRYVVPFLKHHGGFCLWDSSFTRRNSMAWAFHRDFAAELSRACRREGLRFGAYVSVGEWDYPAIRPDGQLGTFGFDARLRPEPGFGHYAFLSGKVPVKDYAKDYFVPATRELLDRLQPDLLWYDGAWNNTAAAYHTLELNAWYYNQAAAEQREVCINDRSGSDYRDGKVSGKSDFTTSEFGHGASTLDQAWEECRSFSHNFGYNWTEETDPTAILSDKAAIDLVVDVIGRGGNLLLIVSPTGSGEVPPRQLHALRNLGDWLSKHGEAIYGTRAYALAQQPPWGRLTHSADGRTVYLHLTQWPADGLVRVPALPLKSIDSARVLHGQGSPGFTQPTKDGFQVDLSGCTPGDPRVTVVALGATPAE
jgi:alpha-L-fucosidase